MEKATEQEIYDRLVDIVQNEVAACEVLLTKTREIKERSMVIGQLFDLTKMYATLKDDFRADFKAGLIKPTDGAS